MRQCSYSWQWSRIGQQTYRGGQYVTVSATATTCWAELRPLPDAPRRGREPPPVKEARGALIGHRHAAFPAHDQLDCGIHVNPLTLEAQMQSGIVYGLTAALKGAITIDRGRVQQSNFHDYQMLRMNEMPVVEVHIVPSTEAPCGAGAPGTPPIEPAVCNAIFAAAGKRLRTLPIS